MISFRQFVTETVHETGEAKCIVDQQYVDMARNVVKQIEQDLPAVTHHAIWFEAEKTHGKYDSPSIWLPHIAIESATRQYGSTPGGGATGISITLRPSTDPPSLVFYQINSVNPGDGSRLVAAVLKHIPHNLKLLIHHDYSGGFWNKMKAKHKDFDWV